ncbi:hypothetical protein GWI33_006493, partial [Rhynchophorus ferrugineus]
RAVAELEPRLFSFNNPFGACPVCDGLGTRSHFSAEKLIPNPELSISQGAIRSWDRQRPYYYTILQKVAEHFSIPMDHPWNELNKAQQKIILQGSGKEKIDLSYVDERGRKHNRIMPFEGVLPYLERRYRETESNYVRDDLAQYLSNAACSECGGSRLNEISRHVRVLDKTIANITQMSIGEAENYYQNLQLEGAKGEIADKIFKEIRERLHFLVSVGLNYLSLARSAETLSGGEAQRIRLASQIGAGLNNVMYVLDEPSIGLHQRDNDRLLQTLIRLRDLGNTVLVVEHDEDAIRAADHIIDIGPGAGVHGGEIIAEGTAKELAKNKNSLTGQYLSGKRKIAVPKQRKTSPKPDEKIILTGASGHNLKHVSLTIPT